MSAEGHSSHPELSALLAEVGQGDAEAFRALVGATSAQVYGALMRFTGDEVAAASLLRGTYEEVWRLAPCFDRQAGPPRSWILALCRSQIVEHGEKQRRGDFSPRGPAAAASPPDDFDVLERCWFGGLRTGPSSLADRRRFARALRQLAGCPLAAQDDPEV